MQRAELLRLAERVLKLPTAPYHERLVRDFVVDHCRELGLRVEVDRVGNVITRYRRGTRGAPLVYVSHMDHPGFEMLGDGRAEFLGGVPAQLLASGRIRVFTAAGPKRVRIKRLVAAELPKRKVVELVDGEKFRKGEFGMWDFPPFQVRRDVLRATAIDDVLGTVVNLATLAETVRRRLRTQVWGVFTRAEEVGFCGAVALARARTIPKNALVVSIEMSRERPWARIGSGPIVRVGDRATIFDPLATRFLERAALEGGEKSRMLRWQRCLMDGGSCEATVFAGFGYRVGGVCLPLGNYHNIGKGMKAQAEYVSVSDLTGLVELTVSAARCWPEFGSETRNLQSMITDIAGRAPRKLQRI